MVGENKSEGLKQLLAKAQVVKRVLATEDGRALMELLRREFFTRLEAKDQHSIVFNAGRADVIAYLMQLNNLNDEGR